MLDFVYARVMLMSRFAHWGILDCNEELFTVNMDDRKYGNSVFWKSGGWPGSGSVRNGKKLAENQRNGN